MRCRAVRPSARPHLLSFRSPDRWPFRGGVAQRLTSPRPARRDQDPALLPTTSPLGNSSIRELHCADGSPAGEADNADPPQARRWPAPRSYLTPCAPSPHSISASEGESSVKGRETEQCAPRRTGTPTPPHAVLIYVRCTHSLTHERPWPKHAANTEKADRFGSASYGAQRSQFRGLAGVPPSNTHQRCKPHMWLHVTTAEDTCHLHRSKSTRWPLARSSSSCIE